jgi:hypothetical protein
MNELNQAIEHFTKAYSSLFDLLEDYPINKRLAEGACGWWSPKHVLDHFCGWLVELQLRYKDYNAGIKDGMRYDFDHFNAISISERVSQTWDDTAQEMHRLASECILMAKAVPQKRAMIEPRYAGLMEALARDCEIHTKDLRLFIGLPAAEVE